MASVYRGTQDAEPRDVAIKVMHPHLTKEETFVKRFRREAKAAARLNHPNSVQILDFGVDDGLLFIAMELLNGRDLFEILVVERRFAEARAVRIVIEALEALAVAHEQGIVHRDLKPENIMVIRDRHDPSAVERVKVLDFGIAKILDQDESGDQPASSGAASSVLTTVGVVVGTPEYMSPEQCRGEVIDARSDIYACGVLLFQLLTGRTPFTADSPVQVAMMHLREEPPLPSSIVPGLNRGLEAVVMKALSKWPAQRQHSARDLSLELQRLMPELSTVPLRPTQSQSPGPITPDGPPTLARNIGQPGRAPSRDQEDVATLASEIVEPVTPAFHAPVAPVGAAPAAQHPNGPGGAGQRTATPVPNTPMVTAPRPLRISPLAPTPKAGSPIPAFALPNRSATAPAAGVESAAPVSDDPATPPIAALAATMAAPAHAGAEEASPVTAAFLKTTLMGAGPPPMVRELAAASPIQATIVSAHAAAPAGAESSAISVDMSSAFGVDEAPPGAPINNTMASAVPVALSTMASAVPVALSTMASASPSFKEAAAAAQVAVVSVTPGQAANTARLPRPADTRVPFPWLPISVAFSLGVVTGVALCLLVR